MGEPSRQISPHVPQELRGLTNQLQSLAGKTTPPNPYTGRYVNPMTSGESQALGSLRSSTYGNQPLFQRGTQQISDTLSGNYLDPSKNPFLSSTASQISDTAGRGLQSQLDSLGGYGNIHGSLNSTATGGLRRRAFDDYSRNLTNSLTGLYGGNYQQERGNQLSALSPALNYNQLPFNQFQNLLQNEALPRQIEDPQLSGQYSDFLRTDQQQRENTRIPFQELLQMMSGYPLAYDQYTPGRSGYQDAGSILGPLAMLYGSYKGGYGKV